MILAILDWSVAEALTFVFLVILGARYADTLGAFIDDRLIDLYRKYIKRDNDGT